METLERQIIAKQDEMIEVLRFWFDTDDLADRSQVKRLESDLATLKSRLDKEAQDGTAEISDINFIKWYSGMEEQKIRNAFERYKKEVSGEGSDRDTDHAITGN